MMSIHQVLSRLLPKLAVAVLTTLCAAAVQAQAYPAKPIRFVVGFAPGGSIDAIARILASHLTRKLGQPVTVENKTGANGVISGLELARAQPDGYTVLISNASMITVTPLLSRKPQYDVEKDFEPVSLIASFPFILMVNPENKKTASVGSLAELIERVRAKPGEYTYGSNGGPGNLAHLSFELLDRMAGTRMVNVPYKGAAESQMALLSQSVDLTFDNPSVMPQIVAGKLKPLAVSTTQRWRDLPDVPTIDEIGYKGFDTSAWAGAFVRAGTPPEAVRTLFEAMRSAGDDPEMRERLKPYGELHLFGPQQFAARIKAETGTYAEIIKSANIQLQDRRPWNGSPASCLPRSDANYRIFSGNQAISSGKRYITTTKPRMMATKGSAPVAMSFSGTSPLVPLSTKSTMPTGGVISPSSTMMTRKMPNQIGSKPSAVTSGKVTGRVISIIEIDSTNMPRTT